MKQKQSVVMKKGSTLILRVALFAMGAGALALCIFALPPAWREVGYDPEYSNMAYAFRGILLAMYIATIPFLYTLYQALKLLSYIDKNQAFSMLSVKALQRIAYSALAISGVFVLCQPFLYIWAQHDDAPGLGIFGMILVGAAFVVAVFAGVMQRLLREAIALKSENDLTV